MLKLSISGIQAAQAANLRVIAAVKPGGALGRAVQYAATAVHRYAVGITHVDTGALRASHRIAWEGNVPRGTVYIDPAARNPRTNALTSWYGPMEHDRGGSHAFYERTYYEAGPRILQEAADMIVRELP